MSDTVILAVVGGIFALLTTVATIIGTVFLAKISNRQHAVRVDLTKQNAITESKLDDILDTSFKTTDEVKTIHKAVNSEREAMVKVRDDLTAQVLALSETVATLRERLKGGGI